MVRKPEAKSSEETKKACSTSTVVVSAITVVEGYKTPHDELMKLPKAQIIREMSVPNNKTRFMVDVDNQTKQGMRILALMESLRDGNAATTKTVTEILAALGNMVDKKPTPKK